jgi:hypothetical protein
MVRGNEENTSVAGRRVGLDFIFSACSMFYIESECYSE